MNLIMTLVMCGRAKKSRCSETRTRRQVKL